MRSFLEMGILFFFGFDGGGWREEMRRFLGESQTMVVVVVVCDEGRAEADCVQCSRYRKKRVDSIVSGRREVKFCLDHDMWHGVTTIDLQFLNAADRPAPAVRSLCVGQGYSDWEGLSQSEWVTSSFRFLNSLKHYSSSLRYQHSCSQKLQNLGQQQQHYDSKHYGYCRGLNAHMQ